MCIFCFQLQIYISTFFVDELTVISEVVLNIAFDTFSSATLDKSQKCPTHIEGLLNNRQVNVTMRGQFFNTVFRNIGEKLSDNDN